MPPARQIAVRAAVVLTSLALATPTHGASVRPHAQSHSRCMDHYAIEWRDWAAKSKAKKAEERENQRRAAEERAAAWDELATSPGISADLALGYRKKSDDLRAGADKDGAQAPMMVAEPAVDTDELRDFCDEVVTVLMAPAEKSAAAPLPVPKAQPAAAAPKKRTRLAAKPRRIKHARTVQRTRIRPRLSVGIGFIGIGF